MRKSISIVTYNMHKGFGVGKVRFVLPKMREAVQGLNADFTFLQEVQGRHDKQQKKRSNWPEESHAEFMAEDVWPYIIYGKNATYDAGHHGNAILSKYPVQEHENINVSLLPRASRSLLHGIVELDSVKVHLICVHLGLFKEERSKQVTTLVDRILERVPMDAALILAGDFNDWRKDLFNALERRLGLKEAVKELAGDHAKSFPAIKPTLRTDRIYYRGLTLLNAECLKGKPWRALSDHLPLYASFMLGPYSFK